MYVKGMVCREKIEILTTMPAVVASSSTTTGIFATGEAKMYEMLRLAFPLTGDGVGAGPVNGKTANIYNTGPVGWALYLIIRPSLAYRPFALSFVSLRHLLALFVAFFLSHSVLT